MFAFAGIEDAVLALLKQVSLSKVHETAAKLGLQNKIDLLREILGSSEGEHASTMSLLQDAKRLSKERNLVAHNRLAVRVSVAPDLKLHFQEFIPSNRNKNIQLTLEQLLGAADEAERIERALWSQVQSGAPIT